MATVSNPLNDLIPARYRKYVYALASLAAIVFTVWQASEGDWKTFVGGLFAVLVPALAASNTPSDGDDAPGEDVYFDGHAGD